jgi:hypothetical protein
MERSRSKGDYFRTLERRISDLQKQVDVLVNRDQSIVPIYIGAAGAPAFQNGWENFSATGTDGNEWCNVRKDSAGNVHVRGLAKNGTAIPGIIFQLPVGYRPSHYMRFAVSSAVAFGHVEAFPTGAGGYIYMYAGSPTWVDFAGIIFQPAPN